MQEFQILYRTSGLIPRWPSPLSVRTSKDFPNYMLVFQGQLCQLLEITTTSTQLQATVECGNDAFWTGGQFYRSDLVFLWTNRGSVYTYYMSNENDLYVSDKEIPSASSALVLSSGQRFMRRTLRLLASAKPSDNDVATSCIVRHITAQMDSEDCILISFREKALLVSSLRLPSRTVTPIESAEALSSLDGSLKLEENAYLDILRSKTIFQDESHATLRSVCSSAIVSDSLVALGLDNGTICISEMLVPFLHPLSEIESRSRYMLTGHTGKVTCLYRPETSSSHRYLLSSADDCTIRIWNIDTYALIATFRNQVAPTLFFSSFENISHSKPKNWLLSVCRRNSVTLFDLDEVRCLYRFFEHDQTIASVSFKFADDFTIIKDSDGFIFVWQLKTGHLDRVESASFAEEILSGCDLTIPLSEDLVSKGINDVKCANARQSISAYTLTSLNAYGLVYIINLKRFISSLRLSSQGIAALKTLKLRRSSDILTPFGKSSSQLSNDIDKGEKVDIKTSDESLSKSSFDLLILENLLWISLPSKSSELLETSKKFFSGRRSLKGDNTSSGIRGASGFLALASSNFTEASIFSFSPTSTAFNLIRIFSLLKSNLSVKGRDEEFTSLLKFILDGIRSQAKDSFLFPSFSFLAKYWQDPIGDLQQSVRGLFSYTLANISSAEKNASIEYWRPHRTFLRSSRFESNSALVPAVTRKTSKNNVRATIILGVIGSEDPLALSIRLCKDVAESLFILLNEDGITLQRMCAIELLARGFSVWEPHLNTASVVRSVISLTGLSGPPVSQSKDSALGVALTQIARQAIVQIASLNTPLFLSTITFDFSHSKVVSERIGGLKLLGMFISKKPLVLYPHLSRIVESMVKSLDPNTPAMREALLPVVTSNFAELVRIFPSVAFHHGSQRLANGTSDGAVVVYDLKTATRIQILEGHQKPVAAVAFSADGRLIATFSLEENSVRLWQTSASFFNSLVGALSGNSNNTVTTVGGVGHMKSFRQFSVGLPETASLETVLSQVRFEWISERSVRLNSIREQQLVFTV
ncbi:hypothetical protein HDU67_009884 [Dinochytrium kinnereticum]|nr:hypothetical protein HDU67_009884 [Dinochytrium kinnereticum]